MNPMLLAYTPLTHSLELPFKPFEHPHSTVQTTVQGTRYLPAISSTRLAPHSLLSENTSNAA